MKTNKHKEHAQTQLTDKDKGEDTNLTTRQVNKRQVRIIRSGKTIAEGKQGVSVTRGECDKGKLETPRVKNTGKTRIH